MYGKLANPAPASVLAVHVHVGVLLLAAVVLSGTLGRVGAVVSMSTLPLLSELAT